MREPLKMLIALALVWLVAVLGCSAIGAVLPGDLPPLELGLFLGWAIVLGYALAAALFRWKPSEAPLRRRLLFAGTVAGLAVLSAFVGLGPLLGFLFSASLVPAHAGMTGWWVGVVASSAVVAFAARGVAGLFSRGKLVTLSLAGGPEVASRDEHDATNQVERILTWRAGVMLLFCLMAGHAIVGPVIVTRFGSDASYATAIHAIVRCVLVLVPVMAVIGVITEKKTRGRENRPFAISILWVLVITLAAGEVAFSYFEAQSSKHGRWWVEHRKSR